MANPNIVNVATINGNTAVANLNTLSLSGTSAAVNVISNAASSGKILKLNTIALVNYVSSNTTANVIIDRSGTKTYLAGTTTLPFFSTTFLTTKNEAIYLLEGDTLQANTSANLSTSMIASFDEIS